MVATALRVAADDLPLLPLFRRTLNWAMKKKVTAVQWPTDVIELRWVRINP
jgi:peptide/nickel transport system substrate-binding protein